MIEKNCNDVFMVINLLQQIYYFGEVNILFYFFLNLIFIYFFEFYLLVYFFMNMNQFVDGYIYVWFIVNNGVIYCYKKNMRFSNCYISYFVFKGKEVYFVYLN